jgi:hypothetical protein
MNAFATVGGEFNAKWALSSERRYSTGLFHKDGEKENLKPNSKEKTNYGF